MEKRILGQTGMSVSVLGMGCWAIAGGSTWGPQDQRDSMDALRAAYDEGITLFDTAEAYGNGISEELIGRTLADVRDRIVLATKVSPKHFAPADLRVACENSLRRLQTDHIDLYQLHWPHPTIPATETFAVLETLRREGKIRAAAVSNFGPVGLAELLADGMRPVADQVAYNLLFRAAEFELQPTCLREHISLLCYSPIMQGLLTGKFRNVDEVPEGRARSRHFSSDRPGVRHHDPGAETETQAALDAFLAASRESGRPAVQLALQWLLGQPAVASVLVGARNPQQVHDNVAAVTADPVDPLWLQRLTQVTDPLKQTLGPSLDMWQSDSRAR